MTLRSSSYPNRGPALSRTFASPEIATIHDAARSEGTLRGSAFHSRLADAYRETERPVSLEYFLIDENGAQVAGVIGE